MSPTLQVDSLPAESHLAGVYQKFSVNRDKTFTLSERLVNSKRSFYNHLSSI